MSMKEFLALSGMAGCVVFVQFGGIFLALCPPSKTCLLFKTVRDKHFCGLNKLSENKKSYH